MSFVLATLGYILLGLLVGMGAIFVFFAIPWAIGSLFVRGDDHSVRWFMGCFTIVIIWGAYCVGYIAWTALR